MGKNRIYRTVLINGNSGTQKKMQWGLFFNASEHCLMLQQSIFGKKQVFVDKNLIFEENEFKMGFEIRICLGSKFAALISGVSKGLGVIYTLKIEDSYYGELVHLSRKEINEVHQRKNVKTKPEDIYDLPEKETIGNLDENQKMIEPHLQHVKSGDDGDYQDDDGNKRYRDDSMVGDIDTTFLDDIQGKRARNVFGVEADAENIVIYDNSKDKKPLKPKKNDLGESIEVSDKFYEIFSVIKQLPASKAINENKVLIVPKYSKLDEIRMKSIVYNVNADVAEEEEEEEEDDEDSDEYFELKKKDKGKKDSEEKEEEASDKKKGKEKEESKEESKEEKKEENSDEDDNYDSEGYYDEEGDYHRYEDEGYWDDDGTYHRYEDEGYWDEEGNYILYDEDDYEEEEGGKKKHRKHHKKHHKSKKDKKKKDKKKDSSDDEEEKSSKKKDKKKKKDDDDDEEERPSKKKDKKKKDSSDVDDDEHDKKKKDKKKKDESEEEEKPRKKEKKKVEEESSGSESGDAKAKKYPARRASGEYNPNPPPPRKQSEAGLNFNPKPPKPSSRRGSGDAAAELPPPPSSKKHKESSKKKDDFGDDFAEKDDGWGDSGF